MNWLLLLYIAELVLSIFFVGFLFTAVLAKYLPVKWHEPPNWIVDMWVWLAVSIGVKSIIFASIEIFNGI